MRNYHNHADDAEDDRVALARLLAASLSCFLCVFTYSNVTVIKLFAADFRGHLSIWEYMYTTEQKSHNL